MEVTELQDYSENVCSPSVLEFLIRCHTELNYPGISIPSFFLGMLDNGHCRKCLMSSTLHAGVNL